MNEREKIFRQEIFQLKERKYISLEEFENLSNTYSKFTTDRLAYLENQNKQTRNKTENVPKKIKAKTSQEKRDRDFTLILILGVILVLLSGLFLATSNWDIMTDLMKTVVIILVGVLFFAVSVIADKVLKIKNTSFAFWVLGSLFLPVAILSVGYFRLFGDYLSIFGDGKYIFGVIAISVCIPVYIYSQFRYKTRLYALITFTSITVDVCFILGAIHVNKDVFFLTLAMYNVLLIFINTKLGENKHLKLFIKDLPLFLKINIIITTVAMVIFTNGAFLSENLGSFIVMISYLVVASNYIYLSYKTPNVIYNYLAPILLIFAAFEAYDLMDSLIVNYNISFHFYIVAIIMYFLLFYKRWKYTKNIRLSSFIISMITIIFAVLNSIIDESFGLSVFEFYGVAFILFSIYKITKKDKIKKFLIWSIPSIIFLGSLFIYGLLSPKYTNSIYMFTVHWFIIIAIMFAFSVFLKKYKTKFENSFFLVAHILMAVNIIPLLIEGGVKGHDIMVSVVLLFMIAIYIISQLKVKKKIEYFLYKNARYLLYVIIMFTGIVGFNLSDKAIHFAFFIPIIFIFLEWILSNYKKDIAISLDSFSLIGLLFTILTFSVNLLGVWLLILCIVWIIMLLYVNTIEKWEILNIIPIALSFACIKAYIDFAALNTRTEWIIMICYFAILQIAGQILSSKFYDYKEKYFIDWYSIGGIIGLIDAWFLITAYDNLAMQLVSPMLLAVFLLLQLKRIDNKEAKRIVKTLIGLDLIIIIYTTINYLNISHLYITELYTVPWIILVICLRKYVWIDNKSIMNTIEIVVISLVSVFLLKDIIIYDYVIDGIILGVLSLIGMISGFQLKIKSYFIIGSAVLILNVIIQTKEFWGNVPWWIYLLAAGLALIIFASLYEIDKNSSDKENKFKNKKDKFVEKFKEWK
ncbi:MAG: hypothetical protein ACERKV_06370 [Clostridiaceae bacterium]